MSQDRAKSDIEKNKQRLQRCKQQFIEHWLYLRNCKETNRLLRFLYRKLVKVGQT